jgi:hypothetical protein
VRHPWANLALLGVLLSQLVTGLVGLLGTSDPFRILFWLHAIGAYALVVLLFAKALIVIDVLRRRPGLTADRLTLGLLALLLVAVLVSGFVWITAGPHYLLGYSVINLHAFAAIALAVVLSWHVLERRWIARVPRARDRRAFLRWTGVALLGVALWRLEGPVERGLGLPGRRRRWTGSYEQGSFSPYFPTVSWLNDDPAPVELASWRLVVEGAVDRRLELPYEQLRRLGHTSRKATIDCTGGWFAHQRWTGVPLAALLEAAGVADGAHSVSVESVTGYGRSFSLDRARGLLLATHVAGEPLAHGHGAPLRLVVPDRRGFEWVKWIVRVRVETTSHLLQPPLPLT